MESGDLMRLIVDPSVLTTYLAAGARSVPEDAGCSVQVGRPDANAHAGDIVLAPAGELGAWAVSHLAHPEIGVVTAGRAAVALLSPVRPDMLEDPVLWLPEVSPTGRLLARAVFERYYGVTVATWTESGENATAVIVEGEDALRPPESGWPDDLGRAWFILNGVPLVTHLLMIPEGAAAAEVSAVADWIRDNGGTSKERRRTAREELAKRTGASAEEVLSMLQAVRFELPENGLEIARLLHQLARDPAFPPPALRVYEDGGSDLQS